MIFKLIKTPRNYIVGCFCFVCWAINKDCTRQVKWQVRISTRIRISRQESSSRWVIVLTFTHIQQSSGFIHQATEVAEGEITCASRF